MPNLNERLGVVSVTPQPLDRFAAVLEPDDYYRLLEAVEGAVDLLAGRIVWNVNSTARGGGVAEMLNSLLPLAKGAGVDARWLVIHAPPEFFRITKRVHNYLHGLPDAAGDLGLPERVLYEAVLEPIAEALDGVIGARDIVVLHDPQTAGLVPAVRRIGARVIWRNHVGVDVPNAFVRRAWEFLLPYVMAAEACIFTRAAYAPPEIPPEKVVVIPPSIDAFSPKNLPLATEQVTAILATANVIEGHGGDPVFTRLDGSVDRVRRRVDLVGGTPVPVGGRIITQVSRWDRLKDPFGVMMGFVNHVPQRDAHLVIAGPAVAAVSDDPEGFEVLGETRDLWLGLKPEVRHRVHLACLPMEDVEENATIVNALQRRASIVVQKSLAEGFGLTVAEAMWKSRPVVASRVGGLQDQLVDGKSGILVDPTDLPAFGRALSSLLEDPSRSMLLGQAARRRCRDEYLAPGHLLRYVRLLERLLG